MLYAVYNANTYSFLLKNVYNTNVTHELLILGKKSHVPGLVMVHQSQIYVVNTIIILRDFPCKLKIYF